MKFAVVLRVALIGGHAAAGAANAQLAPPASPADPSPRHERLAFFEGTWTTVESTPEEGFRETCAWMPGGRRHLVCRSRWNSPTGVREGMSVFSVDSGSGDYVYNGFRSGGLHVTQRGREENGRWQFYSERGSGPERVRTRVSIAPADGGFTFVSETSRGDAPWRESARLHYRRLSP